MFVYLASVKFLLIFFFFFNDTATTEIYTLSLHDALPIYFGELRQPRRTLKFLFGEASVGVFVEGVEVGLLAEAEPLGAGAALCFQDRPSDGAQLGAIEIAVLVQIELVEVLRELAGRLLLGDL